MPEVPLSSALHAAFGRMKRYTASDPMFRDIYRRQQIDTDRARARRASRSRERSER